MAYQALYRKWRPRDFESVVGQAAITDTLKNAIKRGTISHAFLFAGPRGTGKTSCAKIFAKALNCLNLQDGEPCNECENCQTADNGSMPDIMEIDAASNNGVDEIREIRDKVKYAPTQGKYKVYIIDEVHMLSIGAFNALLKTLEEPPEHVVFILATTELQKVPATIISRTQRYSFKRISQSDLTNRMRYILDQEQIKYEDAALKVIAQVADGGMRDALSILDQLLSYETDEINYHDALEITGFAAKEQIEQILLAILGQDTQAALTKTQESINNGASSKNILDELIDMATNSLIINKAGQENADSNFLTKEFAEKIKDYPADRFFKLIKFANNALTDLRYTNQQQIPLDVFLVQASQADQQKNAALQAPAQVKANSAGLSGEVAALKKQVLDLTEKLAELEKSPTAVARSYQVDTSNSLTKVNSTTSTHGTVKDEKLKTNAKKTAKQLEKQTEKNRKQVYQVLENATRQDLTEVKDVWPDLQSVLEVSERALLDVLEPVAASNNQVVMKCKYTLWFEKASSDGLLDKLTEYIERFTQKHYDIVLVPDEDWLAVRKAFVESHKEELLAKKKQQIESLQEESGDTPLEDAKIVDKAKDLFGDAVNVKD